MLEHRYDCHRADHHDHHDYGDHHDHGNHHGDGDRDDGDRALRNGNHGKGDTGF